MKTLLVVLLIFVAACAPIVVVASPLPKPIPSTDGTGTVIFYPSGFEGWRIFQVKENHGTPKQLNLWVNPAHVVQHYSTSSLSENRLVWLQVEWFEISSQKQPKVDMGVRIPGAHTRYHRKVFRASISQPAVRSSPKHPPVMATELMALLTIMADDHGGFLVSIERLTEVPQKQVVTLEAAL